MTSSLNLKSRLQLIVLVALIPVLIMLIYNNLSYQDFVRSEVEKDVKSTSALAAESLVKYISNTEQLLITLSHTDEIQNGTPDDVTAFFRKLHKHYPDYANIGMNDLNGTILSSSLQMTAPANSSDLLWFRKTIETQKFSIGEYQMGRVTGTPVLVFGQPVFDENETMKSVIYASMNLSWLSIIAKNVEASPDSDFLIVDHRGIILSRYPDNEKWQGKYVPESLLIQAMLRGEKLIETHGLDGAERIYAIEKIGEGDLYLAVGISRKAALSDFNNILFINLALLGLFAAAGMWFARNISRKSIQMPVESLVSAAQRLSSGDLTARTGKLYSQDELGYLAKTFDNMAEKIESSALLRDKADARIRENEERLRLALFATRLGLYDLNVQTGEAVVNDEYAAMLGYDPEEFHETNARWIERLHPDDSERCASIYQAYVKGEIPLYEVEFRQRTKSGGWKWILSIGKIVEFDSENKPLRMIGTHLDITERKRAEEDIRTREAEFKEAQRVGKIGSWDWDIKTDTIKWSDELYRILGYDPKKSTPGYLKHLKLYTLESQAILDEAVRISMTTGKPYELDLEQAVFDGERRWLTARGEVKRDATGEIVGLRGTAQDITERKLAEEALKKSEAMLNETQRLTKVGGWEYDVKMNKITWTDEVYRIYGVSPEKYDPNDIAEDIRFYAPEEQAVIERAFNEAVREGKSYDMQLKFTKATGEHIRVRTIGQVEMKDGKVVRVYGYIMDITEISTAQDKLQKLAAELEERVEERTGELVQSQKALTNMLEELNKAMEALKSANQRLVELDRLKSVFLATMSHELRTPLNSIIGFTGIMLQGFAGPLNDEQKKQLEMVKSSGSHLLSLINDVLDISKIEAGQIKVESTQFEMRKSIETVVQIVKPLAEKQGLALHLDVAPDVSTIVSDRRRVEQILFNLLSNAIKFTEKGEVRVECCVRDSQIITRVIDTGIGIKPEHMDRLFKPFIQLEDGLSRRYEGTGLGLSISRKLVEMLGGKVWAESEFGKGSVFTFTLPVKREAT